MIKNPKSLPYVTWVPPNIRKKRKKKNPCFILPIYFLR